MIVVSIQSSMLNGYLFLGLRIKILLIRLIQKFVLGTMENPSLISLIMCPFQQETKTVQLDFQFWTHPMMMENSSSMVNSKMEVYNLIKNSYYSLLEKEFI